MCRSSHEHARALIGEATSSDPGSDGDGLARAFVLAKHGHIAEARAQTDRVWDRAAAVHPRNTRLYDELILVDAHVRAYEDRPSSPEDAKRLRGVLDSLPADDLLGQGLALNQLCIHAFHIGHLDRAQEYAESSARLFRQGGAEFGSLHMNAHLGQIRLMRGDLEGALAQYTEMEDRLAGLPDDTEGLRAAGNALRSEVAYEMNDIAGSSALLDEAMQSIEEDDAWLDVRVAAYRVRTRLAYLRAGLPAALSELAHCDRAAAQLNMPQLSRLMKVERIRVLTLSGETDAAAALVRELGLRPDGTDLGNGGDWALRQGSITVAIARLLVRSRRPREALTFLQPAEDDAIRGGQLLALAKLRVIRSTAHWRLGQKTDATGALLSALRLLGQQQFRRFILDEGREVLDIVQTALDGEHVAVAPGPEFRRCLSELSHAWAVTLGGVTPAARDHDGVPSDGLELQRKYLELLTLGLSNKEIGRTMGVSVNTVKYHLKCIFRDLHVQSRTRAVAEAYRLGILTE